MHRFQEIAMATLASHGWLRASAGQTSTASKEFPSLFGVKEPLVHCTVHPSTANRQVQLYLRGEFFSEGRNPLAAANHAFPAVAREEQVVEAVEAWIAAAEAAMGETFAVRKLRQQERAPALAA